MLIDLVNLMTEINKQPKRSVLLMEAQRTPPYLANSAAIYHLTPPPHKATVAEKRSDLASKI